MLKMAVLAPIPRPSVNRATVAKPGFLTRDRRLYRMSRPVSSIKRARYGMRVRCLALFWRNSEGFMGLILVSRGKRYNRRPVVADSFGFLIGNSVWFPDPIGCGLPGGTGQFRDTEVSEGWPVILESLVVEGSQLVVHFEMD